MSYPAALHVLSRPAPPAAATVVFVHGSLDRGESLRRVMRRLPEFGTVAYDRRGYQGSRDAGVADLEGHVDDLLAIAAEVHHGSGPGAVVAVGHSFGGDVVVGAALASPGTFDAIGAFEPPMPWLGFRRDRELGRSADGAPRPWTAIADDPGDEAERFFGRMVGEAAWARLSEQAKASRRADGPALIADLHSFRSEGPPFDVTALHVPSVFGMGGSASRRHHRRTVEWLGANVPGAVVFEIEGAQHGAHLSHPDHFAAFTRLVVERAADGRPGHSTVAPTPA
jgi:pimeloyl-ACP methyl ester carboxylesterase